MGNYAFTVKDFCRSFKVSRTKLYELWEAKAGPTFYYIGNQRRISDEAARLWQHMLEERTLH
jgi:hypothetical protein